MSTFLSCDENIYLTSTTVNTFDTVEEFENYVLEQLELHEPRDHLFTEVPVYWGERVWKEVSRLESSSIRSVDLHILLNILKLRDSASLSFDVLLHTLRIKTMPTELHNRAQCWINGLFGLWSYQNLLNVQEIMLMRLAAGTRLHFTNGSVKEPDWLLNINGCEIPTIAIETGWSESYRRSFADKELILDGGQGACSTVIIVNWSKLRNQISGFVEVWKWDNGQKTCGLRMVCQTSINYNYRILTILSATFPMPSKFPAAGHSIDPR